MRLSVAEWELIGQTLGFVGLMAKDERARQLAERLGPNCQAAAEEGVEPADPSEPPPPGWHEAIPVDEEMHEAFLGFIEQTDNLKAMLLDLGNRLVTEHGFEPACAVFDPKRDGRLLRSTQLLAAFVAWMNRVPEARKILLEEHRLDWPLGRQRGLEDRACNFT